MVTPNEMLMALHKANPKSLSQRYTPQQLQAAYAGLQKGGGAPGAPAGAKPYQYPQKINDVRQGMNANEQAAGTAQEKSILGQNANVTGPYGSSTTSVDANGQATVTNSLDPNQQHLSDSGTQLSQSGLDAANGRVGGFSGDYQPNTIQRSTTGDLAADRKRYEDSVYSGLTRRTDQNEARQRDQTSQSLENRGIPIGSQQYKDEMNRLDQGFADERSNAANQAVQGGLQEQVGQVGLNEQVIANQQSQGWQNRSGNLSEVGALAGVGPGQQNPNFAQFSGSGFNAGMPTDVSAQQGQIANQRRQVDAQIEALKRRGSGGGTGGGGAVTSSPFVA